MTEYIAKMREFLRSGGHYKHRRDIKFPDAVRFEAADMPHMERVATALCETLEAETPIVLEGERILFWRTVKKTPGLLTERELAILREKHFIHEAGRVCNICPNYARIIKSGLSESRMQAEKAIEAAQPSQMLFFRSIIRSIDAVLDLSGRYSNAAAAAGNHEAAELLKRVPAQGATTFHEALQSLRIIHYTLWCEGEYHNTLGRFDQYMFPYLKADLDSGRLTKSEAFDLLEEFFLSLNRDSDLYPGVQQGDNGQSIMLGGVDKQGVSCFNMLSEMCLDASRDLKLIDPKINLRVNSDTPAEIYEKGTLLTREGLGFPQYSNDDIVIKGLQEKGYSLEDARDYTVAACWEFIIPNVGMDIPNIAAVDFPRTVNDAIEHSLEKSNTYEEFFADIGSRVKASCRQHANNLQNIYMLPAPFMSLLMDGCLEKGRDISLGSKYNNYGFHGVGLSTAVDSIAAVKKLVFENGELTAAEAKRLLSDNHESEILPRLRYEMPKFGNDDDYVDSIAVQLIDIFSDAVSSLKNDRGGCFRAGTGSAMFYLWYAEHVENALSGHRKGEAFSANYAPELFVRNKGPLSVIRSFTKPDLSKVINGGPLTMEFHSSIFRNEESIRKVAALVQAFIRSGGHQLQLNSVNADILREAQNNPEKHKNLIVRIWGWSAYFVELDREYQDHVIARQEFTV